MSDPAAQISETHVIFLDKNHGNDEGISKALKEIEIQDKTVTLKKLYLVPDMDHENRLIDAPFSANFLAQVYAWGQNRSDHQTLNNDDPCKMAEVQTMFIRMAQSQTWNEQWLVKRDLDGFIRIPMSVE